MKKIKTDVIGKPFAKDNGDGVDNAKLIEVNAALRNHPVEKVGEFLRSSMTAMKPIV
jgi:ketol-acid reductoisomerase